MAFSATAPGPPLDEATAPAPSLNIATVGALTMSVTALRTPDIVDEAAGKSVPYRSACASGPGATGPLWPGACHPRVPRTAFSWIQWLGPLVRS